MPRAESAARRMRNHACAAYLAISMSSMSLHSSALTRVEKSMPLALASRVRRLCTSASRYTGRLRVAPRVVELAARAAGEVDLGGHVVIGWGRCVAHNSAYRGSSSYCCRSRRVAFRAEMIRTLAWVDPSGWWYVCEAASSLPSLEVPSVTSAPLSGLRSKRSLRVMCAIYSIFATITRIRNGRIYPA